MRVAVVGATGRIGSLTVAALQRDGHEVVPISRTHGVDVVAGTGLDEALAGVAAEGCRPRSVRSVRDEARLVPRHHTRARLG